MTNLYEATKDMHHACESHAVGSRMSKGNVMPQEWADWLWAFQRLHEVVDGSLPTHMSRKLLLTADLSVLPPPIVSVAAEKFASDLMAMADVTGAAYVLHGAHRSGGRVLAPILVKRGLPCAHICYSHPEEVQAWVREIRNNGNAAKLARQTFECLLSVMDEIQGRYSICENV